MGTTYFKPTTAYVTVVCLVTWPWIGSGAGGDLVLIQTSLLFLYGDHAVLMLTCVHLHMKNSEACIKISHP